MVTSLIIPSKAADETMALGRVAQMKSNISLSGLIF